jgi:hypothetical protein
MLYAGRYRNGRRWGTSSLSAASLIGHSTRKDTSNDDSGNVPQLPRGARGFIRDTYGRCGVRRGGILGHGARRVGLRSREEPWGPSENEPLRAYRAPFDATLPPRLQMVDLKSAAAAEVHRAACSPQGTRGRTGFIRATPLSEVPQSTASRWIARPARSTQIL